MVPSGKHDESAPRPVACAGDAVRESPSGVVIEDLDWRAFIDRYHREGGFVPARPALFGLRDVVQQGQLPACRPR